MTACISRPLTAETPAFDRSWADIMPAGAVVRPADVATRPAQSSSSSTCEGMNERTSWFSAKTAVWDPRILLQAIQARDSEYTLQKAVEWGTKCHSDLLEEEKINNVLRFLAHAIGLQTAISDQSICHSRDSTWSTISSPQSDSASLLDYSLAYQDEDISLPSSCFSDTSDRDRAMEELREIVRNAILLAEADEAGPLGLAELRAAARDITARRAREAPRTSTPPTKPVLSLDTSGSFTPLVRPTTFSPHQPSTPRMRPNKLHKPRPVSPNDPIPLQTFKSNSPECSSPTPLSLENGQPESPTWSHGLLKPFNLKLDVHMITDAMAGLGIRKPASPPRPPLSPNLSSSDLSYPDSPIEEVPRPTLEEPTRSNSAVSEWQYLRTQSGDTDDAPVLATPIDEWYITQFTPEGKND